ncbi:MAG: hypothetical protein E6H52_09050 [Betaproteobacteria bacterium]|jgi:hypothetical protein|nr:MAG: hypothetical protein E6H52_09050 [Betaproteobacteria bacterium]
MKKLPRKKAADGGTGIPSVLQVLFRSFSKLAERAAEGRPLFRGLRIAHDPGADRFVVVHAGSWIEFVLTIPGDCVPPHGEVQCRRMDTSGATELTPIARFRFNEVGVITESTVPELVSERVDQAPAAWSVVAAVLWGNLHA